MDSMNHLFGMITLGCGIYCLYVWIKIHTSGKVPPNSVLLPKDCTMDKCLDPEEFITYVQPRLLIFSILIIGFGLFSVIDVYLGLMDAMTAGLSELMRLLVLEAMTCILPLAAVIWFAVCLRKIQKLLW